MKYGRIFSRLFSVVIFFVTLISIIIAVFFSFKLFERNFRTDVFFYTHDISIKIMRTAGSEFRRYLILKDIGKTIDITKAENIFREEIEERANLFGKNGDFKNLVSSMGYYNSKYPETAYEYSFVEGKWSQLNKVFDREPDKAGLNLFFDRSKESGNIYIVEHFKSEGWTLFFKLDQVNFINGYIKEAVEDVYPEMVFKWHSQSSFAKNTSYFERNKVENYSFNPLKIFIDSNYYNDPLVLEIPAFFDIKRDLLAESEKQKFTGKDAPPFLHTGVFVEIYNEKGSYYSSIEKKAAVNFFKSVIIILIFAALFVLLAIQLQRSRKIRYAEKQFVASVTHELRTPLTVISSAADNLGNGIVPPENILLYSKLIKEQSARLGSMIEEILEYSRFEGNKNRKSQAEEAYLQELMRTMERDFEEISSSLGLRIKWNIHGLPNKVITHPEVIMLVTGNLVSNAINHAYQLNYEDMRGIDKKPEIRISAKILIPNKLEIVVEDDGRGIETRELKHIFEPFYRDSFSRSNQEKGSGLGLFIARQKTIFSGGKLEVKSPYKRIDGSMSSGCRFVLILPCLLPEKDEAGEINA